MKRFISLFLILATAAQLYAQDNLKVTTYKLANGLSVYLNEDHSKPEIYGAVAVKAGGKYDPADATGMGHYLEHMLFKGTTTIGTHDYAKEKPLLDSINLLYDELGKTSDSKQREKVQKQINDLAVRAADYAVPNDLDRMLTSIGSKYVNAFTEYEEIVYYDLFPSHQCEKWLDIYSERFIDPVFRLFQSELETVYEEKNRAMDNFGYKLLNDYNRRFYRVHPYGQQDILGQTEHLKNPSLTKMYSYFNTYYVANNMALVLTGDFDTEKIKPLIEQKFGRWKRGEVPAYPQYKEEPFKGKEMMRGRYAPVKFGVIGWRAMPLNHPDEQALELSMYLLSNNSGTGYLDKLGRDGKLMECGIEMDLMGDYGMVAAFFVPKIVGQSLKKTEKIVMTEISRLKSGDFTDEQLGVAKANLQLEFEQQMENKLNRGRMIIHSFIYNTSWEKYLDYPNQVEKVSRADIVRVSGQYMGENRLVLYSKTGFPKKDKLKKPGFKPVIPKDTIASPYAAKFKAMPDPSPAGKYIDFNKDVNSSRMKNGGLFYYTQNPLNDIFSVQITYELDYFALPALGDVATYFEELGGAGMSADSLKYEMEKLACSYEFYAGSGYLYIKVTGLEKNAGKALDLMYRFLREPDIDEKKWKKFRGDLKAEKKIERSNPGGKGNLLRGYMLYGDSAEHLRVPGLKELSKMSAAQAVNVMKDAMKYRCNIFYTGRAGADAASGWTAPFASSENPVVMDSTVVLRPRQFTENVIYILPDKRAQQSQVYFYVRGNVESRETQPVSSAFTNYFGADMSSLVFQEIREFRSLAYSSYGYYNSTLIGPPVPGSLSCYIGCQGDKTNEAVDIMYRLITDMPKKPERMDQIRSGMKQSIFTGRADFRNIAQSVHYYRRSGYTEDPARLKMQAIDNLGFDDINNFYLSRVHNRPVAIAIVGNVKKFNVDELKKIGKVIIVDEDKVIKD